MLHLRFGRRALHLPPWAALLALVLVGVAVLALLTLLAIVAAGVALMAVPLAVAGAWMMRRKNLAEPSLGRTGHAPFPDARRRSRPVVIDASYKDVTPPR